MEKATYAKTTLGVADGSEHKVLSMPWDSSNDIIGLSFVHVCEKAQQVQVTKRNDPLGIVSPITV